MPFARLAVALVAALAFVPARSAPAAPAPGQQAGEVLHVYGPGGPLPAMKEAAAAFEKAHGVRVEVTAGPTDTWIAKAREDADVVFSGSEHMMNDFVKAFEGRIDESTIVPLYLRPSAILVRPGNPRKISDLPDLAKPGVKVLVVHGAGQTGMWEDMAGRTGDIALVRALRRNIALQAPNTGAAKQRWTEDPSFDAWIVYNIWQVANPQLADLVPVSEPYVIYRDCGVGLTRKGKPRAAASRFVEFLQSKEGAAIFGRWGWKVP